MRSPNKNEKVILDDLLHRVTSAAEALATAIKNAKDGTNDLFCVTDKEILREVNAELKSTDFILTQNPRKTK